MIAKLFSHLTPSLAIESGLVVEAPSRPVPKAVERLLATPLPNRDTPLSALEFVAIDFETTGLDTNNDNLLSFATINLTTNSIDLASSQEVFINSNVKIKAEAAEVNGITHRQINQGVPLRYGLEQLLERIAGKVVIAHGASIERGFLTRYVQQEFGVESLPCHFIDTIALEKKFSYRGKSGQHSSLQLNDLRDYYGLPNYHGHSAASDALSCAELFIAQLRRLQISSDKPLKKLYSHKSQLPQWLRFLS